MAKSRESHLVAVGLISALDLFACALTDDGSKIQVTLVPEKGGGTERFTL